MGLTFLVKALGTIMGKEHEGLWGPEKRGPFNEKVERPLCLGEKRGDQGGGNSGRIIRLMSYLLKGGRNKLLFEEIHERS